MDLFTPWVPSDNCYRRFFSNDKRIRIVRRFGCAAVVRPTMRRNLKHLLKFVLLSGLTVVFTVLLFRILRAPGPEREDGAYVQRIVGKLPVEVPDVSGFSFCCLCFALSNYSFRRFSSMKKSTGTTTNRSRRIWQGQVWLFSILFFRHMYASLYLAWEALFLLIKQAYC